jgi:hypothetical protein
MKTFRNHPTEREPLPMTYWRRRFLAPIAGLAVLAVIAWAFSGVLDVRGGAAATAGHGSPGHLGRPTGGHGNGGMASNPLTFTLS